jgi:glycerophosphoryl diester phosphodiesterase
MTLPSAFLTRPIAHRGLHDRSAGRTENSIKSFEAAIAQVYGIELDLQLSADGKAMVFHDEDLKRLTGRTGAVNQQVAADLAEIPLLHDGGGIPTLSQVLRLVDGRVPLLIEIKDQDGALGPGIGALELATASALHGYSGPVAVMSFNPHAIAKMARIAPNLQRGLVTEAFDPASWPMLDAQTCDVLREIPDYDRVGACFVSHQATDLARPRVAALKAGGAAILCWTIRSKVAETQARKFADNVTFEGYLA